MRASSPPPASSPSPPSIEVLARLLPLADRVESFARSSGRVLVERDVAAAAGLVSAEGEYAALSGAFDEVWDLTTGGGSSPPDVASTVQLAVSLRAILELAATICSRVARLSEEPPPAAHPAIRRLAQLVPDLVQDAIGALRRNDRGAAERVLEQSRWVDAYFAQTYLDLLAVVRENGAHFETARDLHTITRAFERMGDGAGELADSVRVAAGARAS